MTFCRNTLLVISLATISALQTALLHAQEPLFVDGIPPAAPPVEMAWNDGATTSAPVDAAAWTGLEQRLNALESAWNEQQQELKAEEKEKKSKPTFRINGRIHLDYWAFPETSPGIGFFEHSSSSAADFGTDPEDAFRFRRIRLETRGDILETMMYRLQIDFAAPGVAEMKDVWIGFKDLPGNQELLIGNQKRPLGLDHLNSSRYNVFLERPFVVETFNEDARRLGITFYGSGHDESLGWAYGLYNLENIKSDGEYRGDALQLSGNTRIFGSPWYEEDGRDYFHWALAAMVAHPDGSRAASADNANESRFATRPEARSVGRWLDTGRIAGADWYEIAAAEGILNVGPLQIVGELQGNWIQRDNKTAGTGPDLNFYGGYIYVSYFLTGEHIPYNRKRGTIGRVEPFHNFFIVDRLCGGCDHGWGAWNIAARYSYLDVTDGDIAGGVGESVTGAINWHFTPYSKLQFNLIYGDIKDHAPVGGFTGGHYLIAGTRMAIEF